MSQVDSGFNNNAQLDHVDDPSVKRTKLSKSKQVRSKKSPQVVNKDRVSHNNFDGIQISVNSDEEELNYEDDVTLGNMDEDEVDSNSVHEHVQDSHVDEGQRSQRSLQPESVDNGLMLGATSTSITDEEMVMNNPHLKKLLNKMLDERIQAAKVSGETSGSQLLTKLTPNVNTKKRQSQNTGMVKSPSNTTIYIPVLHIAAIGNNVVNADVIKQPSALDRQFPSNGNNISSQDSCSPMIQKHLTKGLSKDCQMNNENMVNKISYFVEQIRLEQQTDGEMVESNVGESAPKVKSSVNAPGYDVFQ